ncbi:MAG: BrnT family toxin [bacterium]
MNRNDLLEFVWDQGNLDKNLKKHHVSNEEIEQTFWDPNKKALKDHKHSELENRQILLGKTFAGRLLFIVFTVRQGKIRVISARDLNKKEFNLYQ